MEELIINMFSLIADQVRNKQELFDKEGKIMQELLNNGYPLHEADAALMLMQTLVRKQPETFSAPTQNDSSLIGMRTMNKEERERISLEAFGFVSKLTRLGVISEDLREEVLEKALTIHSERVELDHIRTLIMFALFGHSPALERERDASPGLRCIKRTAWN